MEAQRKIDRAQSKVAKSKTAATLAYSLMTLLGLGAASWAVSGFVSKPENAARVLLVADETNYARPEQRSEWQRRIEGLVDDPAFLDDASQRMRNDGFSQLGTPAALQTFLKNDVRITGTEPGKIALEARGEGDQPVRVLRALSNAYVSQSNATAERSADGLTMTVPEEAKIDGPPISDPRPLTAAVIFLTLTGLTTIAGALIWRRFAASKHRIEEESTIDAALTAAAWKANPIARSSAIPMSN
jgi:hypothetical protein